MEIRRNNMRSFFKKKGFYAEDCGSDIKILLGGGRSLS